MIDLKRVFLQGSLHQEAKFGKKCSFGRTDETERHERFSSYNSELYVVIQILIAVTM